MKQWLIGGLVVVLVALIPGLVSADDGWKLVTDEPLVRHGEVGDWQGIWNEPGAVLYRDGVYHLFTTGYPGFPAKSGIGYLTSEDGVNFEWTSEEPVLRTADVEYAPVSIGASAVLVTDEGQWVLYFYIFNRTSWPAVYGAIGRATADDPNGPWTPDPEPVLVAGAEGDFDVNGVLYPSVIATDEGYVMYYTGSDSRNRESIGMATSTDGIAWEKQGMVLEPGSREGHDFLVNEVIYDGEQWVMAYKTSRSSIGLATSTDGLTWERSESNPIARASDLGFAALGYISLLQVDDAYVVYFEGNHGTYTDIYAISHPRLNTAD